MSKLTLKYGPFVATIDGQILPEVYIAKPFETIMDFQNKALSPPTGRLVFRLLKQTSQDSAEYIFEREEL